MLETTNLSQTGVRKLLKDAHQWCHHKEEHPICKIGFFILTLLVLYSVYLDLEELHWSFKSLKAFGALATVAKFSDAIKNTYFHGIAFLAFLLNRRKR